MKPAPAPEPSGDAPYPSQDHCLMCGQSVDEVLALRASFASATRAVTTRNAEIAALRAERDALAERVKELQRLAICPPVVTRELARAREGRDKAEAHVATLERAIRDAPHGGNCSLADGGPGTCDCWKAAALRGKP